MIYTSTKVENKGGGGGVGGSPKYLNWRKWEMKARKETKGRESYIGRGSPRARGAVPALV